MFTEVKAIDCLFVLEVISHTFLHFDLYHSSEKGRVRILISNLQVGNISLEWLHGSHGQGKE